jgi:hypothetical protein
MICRAGFLKSKYAAKAALAVAAVLLLTGCGISLTPEKSPVINGEEGEAVGEKPTSSAPIVYGPGSYDSADTPILVSKDDENKTLTFYNLDVERNYTLEYDGTTCFYDKYGNTLSLDQIEPGDIVDVKFIKEKKRLSEVRLSKDSWTIKETDRYSMDEIKKEVTIGEDVYKVASDCVYFSEGSRITESDIISTDKLTFKGIGNKVYSVSVEKGHGYLRLTGHQGFIDGWIEIGYSVIQKVTEDMLITVPEGKYQVIISAAGTTAEKSVVINRNSESSLDFSDVVFAKPKTGTVLFSVNPNTAKLYIDGEQKSASESIELTYGLHQLICKAEGYTTITQYLNVGQPTAGIDITLEKIDSESESDKDSSKEETASNNTSTQSTESSSSSQGTGQSSQSSQSSSQSTGNNGNTESTSSSGQTAESGTGSTDSSNASATTDVTTTYYKVYIDSPAGAEVYLDGAYVGIAPCSFKKASGLHIVTLSKTGYVTRSYTISVDTDDKDVSFSFADLVKEP